MSGDPFVQVLASLAAAISLLERGGKKAAASDRMFERMLDDYRAALEVGRNALSQQTERQDQQLALNAEAAAENWVFIETVNNFLIERGLLEVTREDGGGLEAALNVTDSIEKLIERQAQTEQQPVGSRYRKMDKPDRAWTYVDGIAAPADGYELQYLSITAATQVEPAEVLQ